MKPNLHVIKMDAHEVPNFKELRGKDWIEFGDTKGWKNQWPDYLISLYNHSGKHAAIINGKTDYITGSGFGIDTKDLSVEQGAKINKFLKHPNANETLNEVLVQCVLDLIIHGGFLLEIISNKTKKTIASTSHADLRKYRRGKNGGWWYSEEGWKKAPKDPDFVPDFNPDKISGKQILFIGEYSPSTDVYPLPDYLAAIPYVDIDVEIANFHLNSIKNGFVGGTILNFFGGIPTDSEQDDIEDKVTDKFTGTNNANRILLNFAHSKENGGVEIEQINGNDLDKRFELLNKQTQQEIFTGHGVTDPSLFGIKQDGIFASRNQLVDSFELFNNTYINSKQIFVEGVFNSLLEVMELPPRLFIQEIVPISAQLSEATVVSVMTTDEIREKAGLPQLEEEQVVKEETLSKKDKPEEDKLVTAFADCGTKLDQLEVVSSRGFHFESDKDAENRENELRKWGFIDTAFEMGVLEILKNEPTTPYLAIAEQLAVSIDRVIEALTSLSESGFITLGEELIEDVAQRAVNITPEGTTALENSTPMEAEFKIMYRYVLGNGVSGAEVEPTTRDFCRDLIALSKAWSLAEIQQIGIRENRNVWLRKGGFWTRAGTNITTPYCRHQWEQITVKVK